MVIHDLDAMYARRRDKIVAYLLENDVGAAVFIDSEEHREPAIRYFTGHTSDAVLIIFDTGYSVLIPWDEILARKNSHCDKMIPYTKYNNSAIEAVKVNLNVGKSISHAVELPPSTTYPSFLKFIDALEGWDVRCKENGVHAYSVKLRTIKDDYEIECTKKAALIGDMIIDEIEKGIRNETIKTEMDVALLIERECRLHGCERTGFDTLAAGPERSWAIHAFPGYTDGQWPGEGLSILDFGVVYEGYTSDTTLTVVKGKVSKQQLELVELVEKAAAESLKLYKKGVPVKDAAECAQNMFAEAQRKMPHTLGHGIGLEIHEFPRVSTKMAADVVFEPGMIITLEPGLYDSELGGVRLENDVLITEEGNEVITHSRIIRV